MKREDLRNGFFHQWLVVNGEVVIGLVEDEKGISKIQKVYVQSQASYSVISNESIKRRKPQFI